MIRRTFFLLLFCLTVSFQPCVIHAQATAGTVTATDVISMTQVGLSDQIIIAKIRAHNQPMDLSTEELVNLKRSRVSDAVISALIDPASMPAATTTVTVTNPLLPSGHPSGATTGLAGDPNDPMAPHDSGIYVFSRDHSGKPVMVELERTAYQGAKTGGMFASAMTYGIAKAKSKAIISGKAASIRVGDPAPVFYFYFDDKAAGLGGNSFFTAQNISNPNQFALIHLSVDKNSRQAEIGEFSMWGASSGNNKKDMILFKSERVRPGLYKVTLDGLPLKAGEYCFMTAPVATSSYAGAAGTTTASNLFDFGVDN
jgi:hypothetical protein